jgi:nucleoprotein TPR
VASATTALRGEKDAADALAATRQEQITSLNADVEKLRAESQSRYQIGIRWKQRADALGGEVKTKSEAMTAKEQEVTDLTIKVEELGKELESARGKITELEKKVAESATASAPSAEAAAPAPAPAADNAELVRYSACLCDCFADL